MQKILRFALIALVTVCLVVGIGIGAFSWWVMRRMGPEIWVSQIERQLNCRVEIADASLSLFSSPAKLVFKGFKMAPRDAEVTKVPGARTPLKEGAAPIVVPEISLAVKLEDLMNRRLFVEQLRLVSPVISESINESGRSTLEPLFKKPGPDAPKAVPVAAPKETGGAAPQQAEAAAQGGGMEGFAFSVSKAGIEGGSLTIQNARTTVLVTGLDFSLGEIDIDMRNLAQHNKMLVSLEAAVQVVGQARIAGARQQATLADLKLSGEGTITPVDPASRTLVPRTVLKLTLAKGSVIAGHITMGDAAGKEMKTLQDYGIDLTPVRVGGELLEPAVLEGVFRANIFSVLADTRFAFPDYEVVIARKSHVNTAADKHEIELRLSCGKELQDRLQKGIAGAKAGESIARGLVKALSDERGRMTFDIESEGSLSNPTIKPKVDRLLKNLMRGEGLGDLLQGLLKKL
ncbi:MAG: hypothetical protein CJBNEKGG_03780 [Prosthecobacter sp.]|nr:hypothetical protein [Prosthecobacter sp.]